MVFKSLNMTCFVSVLRLKDRRKYEISLFETYRLPSLFLRKLGGRNKPSHKVKINYLYDTFARVSEYSMDSWGLSLLREPNLILRTHKENGRIFVGLGTISRVEIMRPDTPLTDCYQIVTTKKSYGLKLLQPWKFRELCTDYYLGEVIHILDARSKRYAEYSYDLEKLRITGSPNKLILTK